MAKFLTIEMRFADDVDIYAQSTHDGMLDAVKSIEAVLDARVVGVGEGPDPESAPEPQENPESEPPQG